MDKYIKIFPMSGNKAEFESKYDQVTQDSKLRSIKQLNPWNFSLYLLNSGINFSMLKMVNDGGVQQNIS
jgi:hypothetical protein